MANDAAVSSQTQDIWGFWSQTTLFHTAYKMNNVQFQRRGTVNFVGNGAARTNCCALLCGAGTWKEHLVLMQESVFLQALLKIMY